MKLFSIFLIATCVLYTNASFLREMKGEVKCETFTICSLCGHQEGCLWCADGGGKCVSEDSKQCTNKVNNDYCQNEPCTKYSSCQTCLADAFCGWCAEKGVCIEGEKMGPLTGACPAWEYGRCSKDNQPGAASDNNALPVTKKQQESQAAETDNEATKAIGQIESVANKLQKETDKTKEDQKIIHSASTKAFNIIHALKDMIKNWHARSDKHTEISEHARGVYRKKIAAIMKKRRHSLNIIRKVLETEFKDEMDEASTVKDILTKENDSDNDVDSIDREMDEKKAKTDNEVAPVIPEELSNEDINLQGIAKFLNSMSKRDKVLMTNMHKVAQNNVEQELHKAAVRKMAREEAAWYSCSWLLEDPKSHQCADFHEEYNGPQRGRELTPEEHTRVCNEVQFRLKNLPKNKLPSDAVKGNKDKALAYCVSNVNVLCAKCK
jgi:hypothetical protein